MRCVIGEGCRKDTQHAAIVKDKKPSPSPPITFSFASAASTLLCLRLLMTTRAPSKPSRCAMANPILAQEKIRKVERFAKSNQPSVRDGYENIYRDGIYAGDRPHKHACIGHRRSHHAPIGGGCHNGNAILQALSNAPHRHVKIII